ncbi:MAG: Bifunctional (p)ppGpp synthase/hydrolase SpoT [Legionellaceae bacterium]
MPVEAVAEFFESLRQELEIYLDSEQIEHIYQAFRLAAEAHHGQQRQTGDPYISHPVEVAHILAEMRLDYQSIIAAILHDVIEDTSVQKESIAALFGPEVAELVDGVSKLTQIKFESRAEAQAENFRKMLLAMVKDIRVILVKLADRLHNMRTLSSLSTHKSHRIARETLDIYAPIAHRLGMNNLRVELEDLGFAALYPLRFRVIKQSVQKARGNRREIINTIKTSIKQCLEKQGLSASAVIGRQKHLYSIYQKMRHKHLAFSDIMDVYGFRIIVDKPDTCYRVLGIVHSLYKPVPERFKDYIAMAKANGYQSLHTTLFGPYGVPIEIQIRTADMDYLANHGIAAHWLYKSSAGPVTEAELRTRDWLKNLEELQQRTGNSLEFIENVKIDLFPDEVYVFTPRGNILELPSGATAVDFAYAVHSDVGNSCIAVKIDRRLAALSTVLKNGQTVEVITAPGACPNPAWLNFVATGKARSNIRHYLKSQRRAESMAIGKQLLNNVLAALNLGWKEIPKDNLNSVLEKYEFKTKEDLFEAIGLGNQIPLRIAYALANAELLPNLEELPPRITTPPALPLAIKGTEGLVVHFAECCRPIPGDSIVGILAPGEGIIIHDEQCRQIASFCTMPEKCVAVRWEDTVQGEFKVDLLVELANQRGTLAKLASAVSEAEANIDNVLVHDYDGVFSRVKLTVSVRDRIHLARVMRRIRAGKVVSRIIREKSV